MELKLKKISEINLAPYNPRKISNEEMEKLKNSITTWGYVEPIIVNIRDNKNVVVGGNQRLKALMELEKTEVEVIEVDLDKEKALNIALNRISGEWEEEKLAELLKELEEKEMSDLTGFEDKEISQLLDTLKEVGEDNFEPETDKPKYEVKRGDLFQLGQHKLYCGDATKQEDVERLMGEEKADCVFTDPPYNVSYSSKNELLNLYDKGNHIQSPIKNHFLSEKEYIKFSERWFNNCLDVLNDYNSVYVCGNYESLIGFYNVERFIISNILVWVKNSIILGRMDYKGQHENILYGWVKHHKWYGDNSQSTVWKIDKPLSSKLHPTMKPIELIERAIKNSSERGNIILDLFGGSGSTLIACEQLDRKCRMMEIDEHYCSVILSRYIALKGSEEEIYKIESNGEKIPIQELSI